MRQRVTCKVCKQQFNSNYIHIHKRIHTGEKPYKCSICNLRFMFHSGIHYHKKHAHRDLPKDQQVPLEYEYTKRNKPMGSLRAKCTICLKLFPSKDALRGHSRIHKRPIDDTGSYECTTCCQRFTYSEAFINHICIVGPTKQTESATREPGHEGEDMTVKCLHCYKTFPDDNDLAEHMRVHTSEKLLPRCGTCFKFFRNRKQLSKHVMDVHGTSYSCNKCGKRFVKKVSLDLHIRHAHPTTINPTMILPADMTEHSDEEPASNNTENSQSKSQCSICYKVLPSQRSLYLHMKLHVPRPTITIKKLKCHICKAGFDRRQHLELHSKIHENADQRPYRCTVCHAGFWKAFTCKLHMNRIHNVRYDEDSAMQSTKEVHECVKCLEILGSHDELIKHMKFHSKEFNASKEDSREAGETNEVMRTQYKASSNHGDERTPGLESTFDSSSHSNRNYASGVLATSSSGSNLKSVNQKILEKYYVNSDRMTNISTDRVTGKYVYMCDVCHVTFTLKENFKRHVKNRAFDHGFYLKKRVEDTSIEENRKRMAVVSEAEKRLRRLKVQKMALEKYRHEEETIKNNDKGKSGIEEIQKMNRYKYVCDVCGLSYTRRLNMRQHRNKHTNEAFKRAGVRRDGLTKSEQDNIRFGNFVSSTSEHELQKKPRDITKRGFDVYVDTDEVPNYEELAKDLQTNVASLTSINSDPSASESGKKADSAIDVGIGGHKAIADKGKDVPKLNPGREQNNVRDTYTAKPSSEEALGIPKDCGPKVCPACTLPLLEGQKTISCQLCCTPFCITCSALPRKLYELAFEKVEQPLVVWLCKVCRPLFPKFTVLLHQLGEFEESIDDRISDMEKKLKLINDNKRLIVEPVPKKDDNQ